MVDGIHLQDFSVLVYTVGARHGRTTHIVFLRHDNLTSHNLHRPGAVHVATEGTLEFWRFENILFVILIDKDYHDRTTQGVG